MKYIYTNLLSITCVIIAGIMLYNDKDGWGWFLFAALVTSHTFKESEIKTQ